MADYEKKIFEKQNNYGWAITLNLTNKFPAINKRIFNTLEDAVAFINNYNDSAIEGLILTVINDESDKNGVYFVERVKSSENDIDGILTKINTLNASELDVINTRLSNNENNINANTINISEINNVIGEITEGETIASIINIIRDKIEENTQNIEGNKVIIDGYQINGQNICDNPILSSDDILITNNYTLSTKIEDVLPNDSITNAISKVENSLSSVTLAISASLNQLESEVYGFKLKNITWYELIQLCNNSQLTPGGKYRITDYVTTTSKINTESAGHQFDIIVEALSENVLSENAKACLHDGDDYFTNYHVNIGAWELKYSLYNDKDFRFDWADTINGKGVIYYMKDEWGNEASYDFKNIKKDGKFKFDDNNQDASLYFKKMEL